jgi:hypothetical protein
MEVGVFDEIDFDRVGIRTVEHNTSVSEDHLRALKVIRARLTRLQRTAYSDPIPVLNRIAQMLVHLGVPAADEPIGANDKTFDPMPLPPLSIEQIEAAIANATSPDKSRGPIW